MLIFFLITFLYNTNITCATIQTVPQEIIKKILIHSDFDLDDYHAKIPIANNLNTNKFFQDSPCQIVTYLFKKPKSNLMLTCKQFDHYIDKDIENKIPLQHQLYINFLIENQSIFNFNKKTVLENLALLLFNVYDKKINKSYSNNLEFYEPLAFSLTFKKYHPDNFLPNPYNIPQYKRFFKNVSWFNNNLTFYISEPEKLFLIDYLSNRLNIKFFNHHKPIFEKFLKTNELQKKFLKTIQECIEKKYFPKVIETLFCQKIEIKSSKKIMKIIKFFVSNNIHLYYHFENENYINHTHNRHKNCMRIIKFFSIYKKNCQHCLHHKKELFKIIMKQNIHSKNSFLGSIIKFLIYQNKRCNHTTFENKKIKNWIEKNFPHADYEKFLKIALLIQQNEFIKLEYLFQYSDLLDQNTTKFKNYVTLTDICQKANHLIKLRTFYKKNPEIPWICSLTEYFFNKYLLSTIKCYCFDCNKRYLINNLEIIILSLTAGIITALLLQIE